MRNFLLILNLVLLIFFTASCAIFIAGRPAFIDSSFDYSAMKKRGITVLPVSGGTADRSIREEAGLAFVKELKKRCPDVKLNCVFRPIRHLITILSGTSLRFYPALCNRSEATLFKNLKGAGWYPLHPSF